MSPETFSHYAGSTWKLKYSDPERGVYWQELATLTAAITQTTQREGELWYLVQGTARGGRSFSFEIAARKYSNHRAFMRALSGVCGAGTVVWVGCAAALRRSILQASNISNKLPAPVILDSNRGEINV